MASKSKKPRKAEPIIDTLTVCNACKIRLVVRASESDKCKICGSPDIVRELWRRK